MAPEGKDSSSFGHLRRVDVIIALRPDSPELEEMVDNLTKMSVFATLDNLYEILGEKWPAADRAAIFHELANRIEALDTRFEGILGTKYDKPKVQAWVNWHSNTIVTQEPPAQECNLGHNHEGCICNVWIPYEIIPSFK